MPDKETAPPHHSPTSKGRLLIVDDEVRHAESLATMVKGWGYEVESTSTAARAAGILVSKTVDLVLLDLQMPVADGHRLMDFIRQRAIKTRVIAISGDPSMDDAIKSIKKGADDFIHKPVAPATLLKAIDESLKRHAHEVKLEGVKRKTETKNTLHRLMFDIAPNMLFVLDTRGYFRMVNKVFCKVTGYAKDELLGKHWKSVVERDGVEHMQHVFEERRATVDPFPEVELRLKCKESSVRQAEQKPRFVLVALQSRRLYSRKGKKKTFFGTYGVARDITHYNKLEELNKYREFHDDLTGLPNRILFEDYLSFALTQAKHNHTRLLLLNIVLDDLKQVNEEYGHTVGDFCLKTVAMRLKRQVRRGDTLARIDGSEFLLLLPGIQDEEALNPLIEKIRAGLSEPVVVDGKSISLQVSFGTALFPSDSEESDSLMCQARSGATELAQAKGRQRASSSNWIKLIKPQS